MLTRHTVNNHPSSVVGTNRPGYRYRKLVNQPGDNWNIFLVAIVLIIAIVIMLFQVSSYIQTLKAKKLNTQKLAFSEELTNLEENDIDNILANRKQALQYRLVGKELGSDKAAHDEKDWFTESVMTLAIH